MENGVTWCVRSTMRTSGAIPYITPRQIATESSTTPKSVINTIVGGYFSAARLAEGMLTSRTSITATATVFPTLNRIESIDDELISPHSLLQCDNRACLTQHASVPRLLHLRVSRQS